MNTNTPDIRLRGVVTHFVPTRGFGFLRSQDGRRTVFVHFRDVEPPQYLAEGDEVVYELGEDRDGRPRAVRVRLLNAPIAGSN